MLDTNILQYHAKEVAKVASDAAMRYFRGRLGIEFKSDESPVTQADKQVEAEVRLSETTFPGAWCVGRGGR